MRKMSSGRRRKQEVLRRPSENCPYLRKGNELVIECRECPGSQDLLDEGCLRPVLRIMAMEGGVEEIVLSGDWEMSYMGDSVAVIGSLAKVVRTCMDLSMLPNRFQDCCSCPLSPSKFYASVSNGLPRLLDESGIKTLARRSSKHPRACDDCMGRVNSNLEGMRYSLEELGREVAWKAFRVVGVEDEA